MEGDTAPEQPPGTPLPPSRTRAPGRAAAETGARAPLPPFVAGRPRAAWEPPIWVPPAADPAASGEVPPPAELEEPEPIGFGDAEFSEETLASTLAQIEAEGFAPAPADDFGQKAEDFGQKAEDFGQKAEDFGQTAEDFDPGVDHSSPAAEDSGSAIDDSGQVFGAGVQQPAAPEARALDPQPNGAEATPDSAAPAIEYVAERLAEIATELRAGGVSALEHRLRAGDRLDAVVAAVLAGFLAGRDDR